MSVRQEQHSPCTRKTKIVRAQCALYRDPRSARPLLTPPTPLSTLFFPVFSCNFLVAGAPKVWYSVPSFYYCALIAYIHKQFAKDALVKECPQVRTAAAKVPAHKLAYQQPPPAPPLPFLPPSPGGDAQGFSRHTVSATGGRFSRVEDGSARG